MFDTSSILAHYTSLDAAMSILINRKLWLTDIRFLNDRNEFFDGGMYLISKLEQSNESRNDPRIVKVIDVFKKIVAGDFGDKLLLSCSLSRKTNLLSQWRSYGLYSIELLDSEVDKFDCENHHCVYDSWDKDKYSKPIIYSIWTAVNDLRPEDINSKSEIIAMLLRASLIYKDAGFEEEDEHRLFIVTDINDERIKYRTKNNIYIPYLEVSIPEQIMLQIRIGPIDNQDLAYAALDIFMKNKKPANVNQEIIKSEIPYRW